MAMQPTRSKAAQQPPQTRMSDEDFIKKVSNVGDMLRRNQVSANDGNETKGIKDVDKVYEEFVKSIKNQTTAMKDATDDQKDIFKELVEEMMKLRKDEKTDFDKTFKEMQAALTNVHEKGGDAKASEFLEKTIATAMQHVDKRKPKGGVIREEVNHRIEKFFKPTGDELESPLFRHLAGLDKKDHTKMISPLDEAKNLGTAEKLKNQLGDDITGQAEREKALAEMANTMGGHGKGGAFPSKIENLHVDKLIVKMVERETAEHKDNSPKQISHNNAGKSAAPIPSTVHNPNGPAGATVTPALPAPKDHHLAMIVPVPTAPAAPGKVEHHEGDYLPSVHVRPHEPDEPIRQGSVKVKRKMQDVEDVDFKEHSNSRELTVPKVATHHVETVVPALTHHEEPKNETPHEKPSPIKVKSGNPHVPLRTKETPMASAVRNAVGIGLAIPQKPTIVDSFAPKSDLLDNDVGVRAADATKYTEKDADPTVEGTAKPKDSSLVSTLLDDAGDVLSNLGGGSKGEKVPKEVKPKVEPKTKIGKGLKTAAKIGKGLVKGVAGGLAGAAVGAGLDYAGDELDKSGHDQLAIGARVASKAADWAGTGAMLGSFVPGVGTAVGAGIGGLAGAADGLYENWDKIDKPEWLGGKPKGKVDTKVNSSGEVLHSMHNATTDAKSVPTIIHAPQSSIPNVASTTNYVPITATPRARESYFDLQMMKTFVK